MNSRVLPILALLIAVGVFFTYVSPTWTGTIANTKAAISSDDQALSAAAEYTKRENELAAQRNAIAADDLTRLQNFLPDSVDNVGLILDLDALAARSGLTLSSIDVSQATQADTGDGSGAATQSPVGQVDLTLSAVGTYSALKAFLAGVESSERILDVRQLNVKGSNTGVYTYDMLIRLYWLR